MFEVTVDFVSEIISCVKDKEKKLVSGDPEKIKKVYDTWKFSREIKPKLAFGGYPSLIDKKNFRQR